jgi:hypothetical protein
MTLFESATSLLRTTALVVFIILFSVVHQSCIVDSDDDELAPYAGTRPLILKQVTQSFTPDIQWVGGRVAAIGINRGPVAALDNTLVWLQLAPDNSINSHVTVGEQTAESAIIQFGGVPEDSLEDNTEYTFWLAEREVFDGGLNPAQFTEFNFVDTTLTTRLFLRGTAGGASVDGQRIATISIQRDERLTGERYIVSWPEGTAFRRAAIRQATTGGFSDLIWHIVTHDDLPDNIVSPFVIGEPIPGTDEVIPWPETGFEKNTIYFFWMANSDWTPNTFSPATTPGYTWFRIFAITD